MKKNISTTKARRKTPAKRYTVRVYDEKKARQLEELAEAAGYREMSPFLADSPLRSAEGGLSPWELQALEILTFKLFSQDEAVTYALEKLKGGDSQAHEALRAQAAESKETLALVRAILGDGLPPRARGKR